MQPGTHVADRYRVVREIARGGMGVVLEAKDEKMDVAVALKVTAAAGADLDEVRARFRREARIGNFLGREGKGFVRAFDWGAIDDVRSYLAMDYVAGARPRR
jgi:eukaryotic-like serine/threonine-protein kinase